ncbi:MAG: BamA/TamA family outer membrane protein [Opitutaceae bacterium]|nr:BamA/TamA family outer membrane protein [Cytophagales bacterium]
MGLNKQNLILFIILIIFQSCNTTKFVPSGDSLYTGSKIELKSEINKKQRKKLVSEINKKLKPKPNKTIFGFRYKLAIYTAMGTPKKEKGIRAKIKKKLGEPPVLYSTVNPAFSKEVINAHLFNNGFFRGITSYKIQTDTITTKVIYEINTGPAYKVARYKFSTQDTLINYLVNTGPIKSEIKLNRRYKLEKLKDERERADKILKDQGYYYFNADNLEFEADSNDATKDVYLKLTFKDEIPEKAIRRYTMRKITVLMDSSYLVDDTTEIIRDTLFIDGVHINVSKSFNPKAIANYVFLKENHIYSRSDHQLTLNRLMGMGLFKFVNLQIKEVDSLGLNAIITLSPLPKKTITGEIEAVTKSNNFVGPRASVSQSNRNLLKGGEKLSVNLHGSFETQITGKYKGLYTYEIGPQIQLKIPRFISPFKIKASTLYTPSTTFSASYNFTRRIDFFDMNSLKLGYTYNFRESNIIEHEFTPASLTFFTIRNISSSFTDLIKNNQRLQRRYQDQFISSLLYSYTYNEQTLQNKNNQIYFNGNFDIAGNLASLLSNVAGGRNENGNKTLGGIVYAQYVKIDGDVRNYHQITKKSQFVTRLFGGWGIPYGNSEALPYIRSYFAGGANSVRAFTVNSLGPGSYRAPDSLQGAYFIQQGGDIKLEANAEYRFTIVKVVKGALFADAGNTWLSRSNSQLQGGEFLGRSVIKELGVGGGIGIRIDLGFFIIRLDVATPFRKPWLPENNRWVLNQFDLSNKKWRNENIVFNIAIGYPF